MGHADSLSQVFFALSDATRGGILSRLAKATLAQAQNRSKGSHGKSRTRK